MPVLIVLGLVGYAFATRDRRGGELPGPIVAALVMLGIALVTASFWLVNIAAFVAVVWFLASLSGGERRVRTMKRRERRLRKWHRKMHKVAGKLREEWPEMRLELEQASRAFQGELSSFLHEVKAMEQNGREKRELVPVGPNVTPERPKSAPAARTERPLPQDELSASIERLLRDQGGRLPPEAVTGIRLLSARIRETNAYLAERDLAGSEFAYLVRQTALDYLPGAVNAYLRLPASLADSAPLEGDKTGKDLLLEQVGMLRTAVEGVLENAARAESQHLLAHGRFLEQKLDAREKEFEV